MTPTLENARERPILFSGAMIRAILADLKTQTRRVVKPQPKFMCASPDGSQSFWEWTPGKPERCGGGVSLAVSFPFRADDPHPEFFKRCPYGKPGDRLWVREAWATRSLFDDLSPAEVGKRVGKDLYFPADDSVLNISGCREPFERGRLRPSIHMPRWASRITLEVTGVRVERLQEISEEDALAEGIRVFGASPATIVSAMLAAMKPVTRRNFLKSVLAIALGVTEVLAGKRELSNRSAYALLWGSINGKRPGCAWADNPFVRVVEFRRLAQ